MLNQKKEKKFTPKIFADKGRRQTSFKRKPHIRRLSLCTSEKPAGLENKKRQKEEKGGKVKGEGHIGTKGGT